MTRFALAPGPAGARYDGPHGPVAVPAEQAPDATRVLTPAGEATLAWGMLSGDRAALGRGVPLRVGDRKLVLRRDGRALTVADGGGASVLAARRRRGGRLELARPDGAAVAWCGPDLAGEVRDGARPDEVAILLLLMASGVAGTLERRLPLLPFALPG